MGPDGSKRLSDWSLLTLVGKIWPIGVLGSLFHVWNCMECSLFTPYLYTRVQCCGTHGRLPGKYDITEPKQIQDIQAQAKSLGFEEVKVSSTGGNNPFIPACSVPAFPRASALWSKSAHCVSASFVGDSAQRVIGLNTALQTVATLVVLPVAGTVADRCGRRPVFMAFAAMVMLACAIYVLDTRLFRVWGNAAVFLGGMLMCPCWEPKDTVVNGAITDIVGNSGPNLRRALTVQQSFNQAAWLIGFIFAFVTLGFHLQSYTVPWIIFTCVAGSIMVFLLVAVPETLPEGQRGSIKMYMLNPLTAQLDALLMMWQDPLLVLLMLNAIMVFTHFVGFITIQFTYLVGIGFSEQEALLPAVVMAVSHMVFLLTVSKFGGAISTLTLYAFGQSMFILSYLIYGPLSFLMGKLFPYIAAVFSGVALGCFYSSSATIISSRVGQADQAQCQAGVAWIGKFGSAAGPLIWNYAIFDATATAGRAAIRPSIVSLLMSLVTTAMALYMKAREDSFPPVLKLQAADGAGEHSALISKQRRLSAV